MSIQINAPRPQEASSLTLDNFREMVNLKSGSNKGYVRFQFDKKGKISGIEKVGNKFDRLIGLRKNVSAANNQRLRDEFCKALTSRLCNATDEQKRALERLVKGIGATGTEISTKPLSRREVRNALEQYDLIMNSTSGRQNQVRDMFDKMLIDSGFLKTGEKGYLSGTSQDDIMKANRIREAFVAKYMSGGKEVATFNKGMILPGELAEVYRNKDIGSAEYEEWKTSEDAKIAAEKKAKLLNVRRHHSDVFYAGAGERADVQGAHTFKPMEVPEADFKQKYMLFQENMRQAVNRCKMECGLHSGVKTGKLFEGVEGDRLKNLLKAHVRTHLNTQNIDPNAGIGGDVGTKGCRLEMFIDVVLPALAKKAHEDFAKMDALADSVETEEDRLDSLLDLQEVCDQAVEYFKAIADGLNGGPKTSDDLKKIGQDAELMAVKGISKKALLKGLEATPLKDEEVKQMLQEFAEEVVPKLKLDQKLDKLTTQFVASKYGVVIRKQQALTDETDQLIESAVKEARKISLAGKLVLGEKLKGESVNKRNKAGSVFVAETVDAFFGMVQGRKGLTDRKAAFIDITEVFLPNAINQKIKSAFLQDGKLQLSKVDQEKLQDELGQALDFYALSHELEAELAKSVQKSLTKQIMRLVKDDKLSQEEGEKLLCDRFAALKLQYVRQTVRTFLQDLQVNEDSIVKRANVKKLKMAIENGLKLAQTELREEIVVAVAQKKISGTKDLDANAKKLFSSDASQLVSDELQEIQRKLTPDFDLQGLHAAVQYQLDKLRLAALNNLLKVKGDKMSVTSVNEAANTVIEKLHNMARDIVNQVVKLRAGAAQAVKAQITEGLKQALREGQSAAVPNAYGSDVPDAEFNALVAGLTDRIFADSKEIFDNTFRNFYVSPMDANAKEVNQCLVAQICWLDSANSAEDKFARICAESAKTIKTWLQSSENNLSGLDKAGKVCETQAQLVWNDHHPKGKVPVNNPPEKLERDKETQQRLTEAFRPEKIELKPNEDAKFLVFAQVPEKSNGQLVAAAVNRVRKNVEKHTLLYTHSLRKPAANEMGDAVPIRDEFDERIKAEVMREHLRLAEQYVKLHAENAEGFARVATKFAGLQEAPLREVLHETLAAAITGADPKLLKPKYLLAFFERNLDNRLKMTVGWKVDEFNQYVIDYEKAEQKLEDAAQHLIDSFEGWMKDSRLPEAVQNHIRSVLLNDAMDKLTYWLARDPSQFLGDELEKTKARLNNIAKQAIDKLSENNLLDAEQYGKILLNADFWVGGVKEDVLTKALKELAATENPAENVRRLNGIFDAFFSSLMTNDTNERVAYLAKSGEIETEFRKLVNVSCGPQLAHLELHEYNQLYLPTAQKLFGGWLDKFDAVIDDTDKPLSTVKVDNNLSVRELAEAAFVSRHKQIADAHLNGGDMKSQPLLSVEFVQEVVSLYSQQGVRVAMDSFLAKKAKASFNKIIGEKSDLFSSGLTDAENAKDDALKTCRTVNGEELKRLYEEVCLETRKEMMQKQVATTIEAFARVPELIEEAFKDKLVKRLEAFVARCKGRVELAAQFNLCAEKARERIAKTIMDLLNHLDDEGKCKWSSRVDDLITRLNGDLNAQLKQTVDYSRTSIQNLTVDMDSISNILTTRVDFVLRELAQENSTDPNSGDFREFIADVRKAVVAKTRADAIDSTVKVLGERITNEAGFRKKFGELYDVTVEKLKIDTSLKYDYAHPELDTVKKRVDKLAEYTKALNAAVKVGIPNLLK